MGCVLSAGKDGGGGRRLPANIGEVAVLVPGIRIPKSVDLVQPLGDSLTKSLVHRLSALRTKIVVMAAQEAPVAIKPRRRAATRHGGSTINDLQQALEDYLPVLLGLVENGNQLNDKVAFAWINQEDAAEETVMANVWYEVLSVLHLMAMLCLSEANLLLLPKSSTDRYQTTVTEESKRNSVDVFLKAAGYLDCAVRHVLPQIPSEFRSNLPVDVTEGVLRALCMQALGQGVDVQLGIAINSPKATLAVKRRLACELVKYWHQAQDNIGKLHFADGWGEKHQLYIKWKYAEAKAAAYYYHGLILDERSTEKSHGVAAMQAAEEFINASSKAREAFNTAPPKSRNPPLWGSIKYLLENIPKHTPSKVRIDGDFYSRERILETAPTLPEFSLSLKPDEYQLPPLDPSWNRDEKQ